MYKMRSKNSIPACELKESVLCLHMQEEAAIETHVYTVCVQISTETFNIYITYPSRFCCWQTLGTQGNNCTHSFQWC